MIARVVAARDYDVQPFVREADIDRIATDALARFIPEDPMIASRHATLREASNGAIQNLDQPILASAQGGPVAVREDAGKSLHPREALYRMRFVATPGEGQLRPIRGTLHIDAQNSSAFGQLFGAVARMLRAEASMTG